MLSYDGEVIASKLEVMSARQAKTFAAACAELLTRFFADGIPREAIDQGVIRSIVDTLWNSNELEEGYAGDSSRDSERLSSVLSGDYAEELGVGEHAISGIYYAVEELRSDDHGMAELSEVVEGVCPEIGVVRGSAGVDQLQSLGGLGVKYIREA